MKRILALFLATLMLLATLSSCDFLENFAQIRGEQTDSEATTPDATTPEGTTPEETTPPEVIPPDPPVIEVPEIPDFNNPAEPTDKLATEIVASLEPAQVFEATFDCQEAILTGVDTIYNTLYAFWQEGYTRLDVDTVTGAKFNVFLLTKGEELVTVYWLYEQKEVRITWETTTAGELSVLQKNATTGTGTVTMVQIGVERGEAVDNPMIGLCYIFKLANGNAIVIDGGYYYDECAANVYGALAKLDVAKNEDGQFVIEAWIFTHGHGDHNGVFNNFAPLYADKVDVLNFLYQFSANEDIGAVGGGKAGEEAFHELCKETYPEANFINPHVGLKYYFSNVTIDMLYTPDVHWDTADNKITYYNDSSLIFNVLGGGTGFLCMGDAGEIAATRSWQLFEARAYTSGILQIAHHGMTTGLDGSHKWDNIRNIYVSTGASIAALPLGTRTGEDLDTGNGRWAILFDYPYNKNGNMSYIVKKGDAPTSNGYFYQGLYSRFVHDVLFGTNLAAEAGFPGLKSLHGYNGINMIDNGDGITTYIAATDFTEMATEFLFSKGKVTVKKNEELDAWLKLPDFYAKDVIAKIDANAQIFESTFGVQEVIFKNVTDKASITEQFTACGFETVASTMVEGAKMETLLFTNGMELVTVYWKPAENEVRVLFEKLDENVLGALLPNETTGTGELTMVQVGVQRGPGDTGNPMIGMCYVIKLSDGRAIILDGGFNYENNADNLFGTLSRLNIARNENGQYIVAAWFFSHGDGDHIGIMSSMGKKYSENIEVEYIIHQLPSNGAIAATSAKGENEFFAKCEEIFPNAIYVDPHAGVQYFIGNAVIGMLYTPDLVWSPESKITYYNSTSIVFKVNGGDVSFLSTGDAGESAFKVMWENYEPTAFACDMFQVPHHGLTTQNKEDGTGNYADHVWTYMKKVFDATDAKYAVLPMGDRNPYDSRNGRATVIIFWGSANCVISYFIDKDDKSFGAMSAENYQAFVDSVAAGTNTHKTYLGYNGINILDNGEGLTTYIASSETGPMATVFTFANGEVVVERNDELYDWLAEPLFLDSFESTFDSDLELYGNVWDINLFVDQFKADGYTLLDVDMIEGAKFQTIMLTKGTSRIVLYWFPELGEMRLIRETVKESANDPLSPNEETGKGEIVLVQLGVDVPVSGNIASTENNPNIGLCYIFKLSNGRAMVVDGGWYYDSNADNLYLALESLDIAKNENGEFIIEAWFFTHGHGDHNGITKNYFDKYKDKTQVNYFVYQVPSNNEIAPTGAGYAGEAAFHELCLTACPEATYLIPHSGVKYYFGNATVEMLHTPDILWSPDKPIPDYNDTGIIFKTGGGGVKGFLCMGDSCEYPAAAAVKNYDVLAFDSDIVQIAHHGLNTQINEGHEWKNLKVIYEGATVKYAFLPMGVAKPNVRSGRWSVICAWGNTGKQASFVINPEDTSMGVDQSAWNAFVSGILDGSLEGKTLLGYNGYNIIDNGRGVTTYIHCSETAVMMTVMTFADGEVSVDFNDEFNFWLYLTAQVNQ